jgi:hypothetical protein
MEKERQGDATNEAFHLKLYDDIHNFSFLRGAIWLYYVKLKKKPIMPTKNQICTKLTSHQCTRHVNICNLPVVDLIQFSIVVFKPNKTAAYSGSKKIF